MTCVNDILKINEKGNVIRKQVMYRNENPNTHI